VIEDLERTARIADNGGWSEPTGKDAAARPENRKDVIPPALKPNRPAPAELEPAHRLSRKPNC
jgi:hypothetical protein